MNQPHSQGAKDKDFVFGIHPVSETILAGKEIDRVLIQKDLKNPSISEVIKLCIENHVPFVHVPLEKLNRITRKNHQGVICFTSSVVYASLDNIISNCFAEGKMPFILILDRITDVRNFGAIVRTAECAGVDAIVIPEKGSARMNGDAYKTSAGALNLVPICRDITLRKAIMFLKDSGLQVIACTEKAEKSIYKADLTAPTAVIMGSEEDGILPENLKLAHELVQIPLLGKIGSLNVSVATGVMLYEVIRQRQ
jgi:23S rRNA (guanosine2251-2'-O)-methyltransferase